MDEYSQSGIDPEVKKYFRKIINSFSYGLLWLLGIATAGFFFKLGKIDHELKWYNIIFYTMSVLSFAALARYYYRLWNKKPD